MKPHFKGLDVPMFYKYLDKSTYYFEFGSGGSTYQAATRNNIKTIYTVESDAEWHNKLKAQLKKYNHIKYLFRDLETPGNNWGYPGKNCSNLKKIAYSHRIYQLTPEEKKKINLILIDGRFRVACALKSFNIMSDDCVLAFDDFMARSYYHIVLNYFDIVEKSSSNLMVMLKKKKNCKPIPPELIMKYELKPE